MDEKKIKQVLHFLQETQEAVLDCLYCKDECAAGAAADVAENAARNAEAEAYMLNDSRAAYAAQLARQAANSAHFFVATYVF